MRTYFTPNNNPRVIIIQKLYGKFYNDDDKMEFPKHRFKKFIKDIVLGTIERNDLILDELQKKVWDYSNELETHTVETHIYRLRKKIKEKFNDGNFIISSKNGYIIN